VQEPPPKKKATLSGSLFFNYSLNYFFSASALASVAQQAFPPFLLLAFASDLQQSFLPFASALHSLVEAEAEDLWPSLQHLSLPWQHLFSLQVGQAEHFSTETQHSSLVGQEQEHPECPPA
jgi:hypothetical protein